VKKNRKSVYNYQSYERKSSDTFYGPRCMLISASLLLNTLTVDFSTFLCVVGHAGYPGLAGDTGGSGSSGVRGPDGEQHKSSTYLSINLSAMQSADQSK